MIKLVTALTLLAAVALANPPPLPLALSGERIIRRGEAGTYEVAGRSVDTSRTRFSVAGQTWRRTRDGWKTDKGERLLPGQRPGTWTHTRNGALLGIFTVSETAIVYRRTDTSEMRYSRDTDAIRRSGIEDYLRWRTRQNQPGHQ